MVNMINVGQVTFTERPNSAAKLGFGSALPRHSPSHDLRYFDTEHRSFYGRPPSAAAKPPVASLRTAGTNVRPMDQQGTKIISNLVGEIYSKEYDP
jgi:hypothetical protein